METTEKRPAAVERDDHWVEIPAYYPDGGLAGDPVSYGLQFRPGTNDERVRLSISGSDYEYDLDALEEAVAKIRGYAA